jgi:hypothetical protein
VNEASVSGCALACPPPPLGSITREVGTPLIRESVIREASGVLTDLSWALASERMVSTETIEVLFETGGIP